MEIASGLVSYDWCQCLISISKFLLQLPISKESNAASSPSHCLEGYWDAKEENCLGLGNSLLPVSTGGTKVIPRLL